MPPSECYPSKSPKVNRLFDTLSHHLRREVLYYFEVVAVADVTTLDELVGHVVQRVPDVDSRQLSISLLHSHLPKLDARGWLDFDRAGRTIQYHGHESAESLLRDVTELFVDAP